MAKASQQNTVSISITPERIEAVSFSSQAFSMVHTVSMPMPFGLLDHGGDRVTDVKVLGGLLKNIFQELGVKEKTVCLSIPGTLLRLVDMPKSLSSELYLSLSSEAERYKPFDGSEAVVAFHSIDKPGTPGNLQNVVFGAVRKDTLNAYLTAFHACRVKLSHVDLAPLNTIRAMAGTGVLDSLVEQIGAEAYWGTFFVEPERVRLLIWRGNQLVDLREIYIDTTSFEVIAEDDAIVSDLIDEIRRTTKDADPTIWLYEGLPDRLAGILSSQMAVPFRKCFVGPTLQNEGKAEVMLSTVGAAFAPYVPFPFEFNLLMGAQASANAGKKSGASTADSENTVLPGEESPYPAILTGLSVVGFILILGISALLFLGNWLYLSPQADKIAAEKQQKLAALTGLNQQIATLRQNESLRSQIQTVVNHAEIRNQLYVNLVKDLQAKIPKQVWLHTLDAGNQIVFEGKSTNHQSVLDFAKNFDDAAYISSVLIDTIQEELLGKTKLYQFKFEGAPSLNPQLLEAIDHTGLNDAPKERKGPVTTPR